MFVIVCDCLRTNLVQKKRLQDIASSVCATFVDCKANISKSFTELRAPSSLMDLEPKSPRKASPSQRKKAAELHGTFGLVRVAVRYDHNFLDCYFPL